MASTSVVFDILARDRASGTFDKFGNSVDGTSSKMSKFTGLMKTAGKAAAYGLGAGLVIGAGAAVKFAEAAAEDEQAATLLAGALEKNAGATKKQVAQVEDWITAIGRAKGVADDDLRPALSRLVTATHDVQKAQLLAQVAMDVSAGSGKSLEAVSTALMKAQNGQVSSLSRLGINTKNAAGETISMEQAVRRMSETFGGAASEKANTFQGKLDRLRLMASEAGESIGYKLLPLGIKLTDWITSTAIPAVEAFTEEWKKGVGTGGQVRAVLEKVGAVVVSVSKFVWQHKEAVAALAVGYVAFKGVLLAVKVQQAISLALLKAHTVGTIENTVVTKAAAAATKVWAAGQWLLNAALTANPIGLVIVGVAALSAGIFIAYKKSETFRTGVHKVWEALKKFIGFTPLASLISAFRAARDAVQWVIDKVVILWDKLSGLGDKIGGLKDAATTLFDLIPRRLGESGKGAGEAWMAGFIKGAERDRSKWLAFLSGLMSEQLDAARSALADFRDKRNEFANFSGFRGNLFGADISGQTGATTDAQGVTTAGPTGLAALKAYAAAERVKAAQLAADVAKLTDEGISQDLLDDLKSQGASGLAQIHALASASQAEANQIFADMAAANASYQTAGTEAASRLDDQLATMGTAVTSLARNVAAQPIIVEIHMTDETGRTIVKKVKAEQRATGHQYFVVGS